MPETITIQITPRQQEILEDLLHFLGGNMEIEEEFEKEFSVKNGELDELYSAISEK